MYYIILFCSFVIHWGFSCLIRPIASLLLNSSIYYICKWEIVECISSDVCQLIRQPYYYRLQTKFAKVMFLHMSVSHSVHRGACMVARGRAWLLGGVHGCGGHAWLWGACMVARGCAWLQGGMCGCEGHAWLWGACTVAWGACVVAGGCAWLQGACMVAGAWVVAGGIHGIWRDTVNEWAVRILLECILVERNIHSWERKMATVHEMCKNTKRFHPQKTKCESVSRMSSRSLFENKFPEIFQIWRLIKHLSQHWYWPKFIVVTIS